MTVTRGQQHPSVDTLRVASGRTLITVGRAAEILKVKRQAVRQFVEAGELHVDTIIEAANGSRQYVFRKSEVHRFNMLRAERWRRQGPTYGPQLALPLQVARARRRPLSPAWRDFQWRPTMVRATLPKAKPTFVDRQVKPRQNTRKVHDVA
jgi:hypothetical protein